ncbi:transglycosylase SLT domain-containing protein [Kitasatospora camelliae]|uniref:Transglycosylase SLT domain-containing protein n=1 Tax=Kitasatospora camelliae TaxID=3156397 RepID=A0AAU8K0N2_9ACTN
MVGGARPRGAGKGLGQGCEPKAEGGLRRRTPQKAAKPQPATPQPAKPQAPKPEAGQAEQAKQAEKAEKSVAASRSEQRTGLKATGTSPAAVRELARDIVPADQFAAFDSIINHESGWNIKAVNASSGAYGLAQALPGSKMASVGADWQTNPETQITWALTYMNERYGSPNAAWAFWQTHHWY